MITIKSKYNYGDSLYVVNDEDQTEYILTGVLGMPGGAIKYRLSYLDEEIWVYDYVVTDEFNQNKTLGLHSPTEEE